MVQITRRANLVWQLILVSFTTMLVACHSGDSGNNQTAGQLSGQTIEIHSNDDHSLTELALSAPERLRSVFAIDPSALVAVAVINGVETQLQLNASGQFTGQFPVPAQSSVSISIEFYEMYSGERLTLATLDRTVNTGSDDTTVNLSSTEYVYDVYDFDGDNVSNIVERENNFSPLDAALWPEFVSVDVVANRPSVTLGSGFNNYDFEVTAGDETVTTPASDGDFRQSFQVVKQSDVLVQVRLIERQSGQQFVVGRQSVAVRDIQNSTSVLFEAAEYDLEFDADANGDNDLAQLAAGNNLFAAPVATAATYTVNFNIPASIDNPATAFALLTANGANIDLVRTGNSYSGTAATTPGTTIFLEVVINDTYQGQALTLASFSAPVQPSAGQSFTLENFSLVHDDDSDGVFNYLELAQGTDPFSAVVAQCTPVQEVITIAALEDAYTQNGQLFNQPRLRVDKQDRIGLIRYQYDGSRGTVTAADLVLTVGTDEGDGLISVFAVPDLQWSATDGTISLSALGAPIATKTELWTSGDVFTFFLDPGAITSDFTMVLTQEDAGNDVAFSSNETSAPPLLRIAVERCE